MLDLSDATGSREDAIIVLLRRYQSGDREAFAAIWQEISSYMYRVIVTSGARPVDAEDIVQDAGVTLLRRLPECNYRSRQELFAYCRSIAKSRFLDRMKSETRKPAVSVDDEELFFDTAPGPEDLARINELTMIEKHCAGFLSDENQEIWWGRYRMSNNEIGEKLGKTSQQISRKFHSIREKMRHCVSQKLSAGASQ